MTDSRKEIKEDDISRTLRIVAAEEGGLASAIADLVDTSLQDTAQKILNQSKDHSSYSQIFAAGAEPNMEQKALAKGFANVLKEKLAKETAINIAAFLLKNMPEKDRKIFVKEALIAADKASKDENLMLNLTITSKTIKIPKDIRLKDTREKIQRIQQNLDNKDPLIKAKGLVELNQLFLDKLPWLQAFMPNIQQLENYIKQNFHFKFEQQNENKETSHYRFISSNTKYYKALVNLKNKILEKAINAEYQKLSNERKDVNADLVYQAIPALQVNDLKEQEMVKKALQDYLSKDLTEQQRFFTFPFDHMDFNKLALITLPPDKIVPIVTSGLMKKEKKPAETSKNPIEEYYKKLKLAEQKLNFPPKAEKEAFVLGFIIGAKNPEHKYEQDNMDYAGFFAQGIEAAHNIKTGLKKEPTKMKDLKTEKNEVLINLASKAYSNMVSAARKQSAAIKELAKDTKPLEEPPKAPAKTNKRASNRFGILFPQIDSSAARTATSPPTSPTGKKPKGKGF